jgi:hypothetical protein
MRNVSRAAPPELMCQIRPGMRLVTRWFSWVIWVPEPANSEGIRPQFCASRRALSAVFNTKTKKGLQSSYPSTETWPLLFSHPVHLAFAASQKPTGFDAIRIRSGEKIMSEAAEDFMLIGGKKFTLTPREGTSTKAKSFVKHDGAFFTVTPVAAVNLAVAAVSPVAANAAIPFAAEAEAGEITEADVQKLLIRAIQEVRENDKVRWEDVKGVHIGDDLENPPVGKQFFIDWIQSEFNKRLIAGFPNAWPIPDKFLSNWSMGNPQATYESVVKILYRAVLPA